MVLQSNYVTCAWQTSWTTFLFSSNCWKNSLDSCWKSISYKSPLFWTYIHFGLTGQTNLWRSEHASFSINARCRNVTNGTFSTTWFYYRGSSLSIFHCMWSLKKLSWVVFPQLTQSKYTFELETGNVEGQGQRQGWQWIVLIKAHIHVKFNKSYYQ